MLKREKYEDFLYKWDLLKTIADPYEKTKIADAFDALNFVKGEVILKKGDTTCGVYIVESGQVNAVTNDKVEFSYGEKEYFGELPLIKRTN